MIDLTDRGQTLVLQIVHGSLVTRTFLVGIISQGLYLKVANVLGSRLRSHALHTFIFALLHRLSDALVLKEANCASLMYTLVFNSALLVLINILTNSSSHRH